MSWPSKLSKRGKILGGLDVDHIHTSAGVYDVICTQMKIIRGGLFVQVARN